MNKVRNLTRQRNGETFYLIQNYSDRTVNQEVWTTNQLKAHSFESQKQIDDAESWLAIRETYRKDGN